MQNNDQLHQEKVNDLYFSLKKLVDVLDEKKILYWLVCGSLLGAVRHGGLIPWDSDIDVQIHAKDMVQRAGEIDAALRRFDLKFEVRQKEDAGLIGRVMADDESFDSVEKREQPYVDVYSYDTRTGLPYLLADKEKICSMCMAPDKLDVRNLGYIKFGPYTVRTIANTQAYLDRSYGPSWRYVKESKNTELLGIDNTPRPALPTKSELSRTVRKRKEEKMKKEQKERMEVGGNGGGNGGEPGFDLTRFLVLFAVAAAAYAFVFWYSRRRKSLT